MLVGWVLGWGGEGVRVGGMGERDGGDFGGMGTGGGGWRWGGKRGRDWRWEFGGRRGVGGEGEGEGKRANMGDIEIADGGLVARLVVYVSLGFF